MRVPLLDLAQQCRSLEPDLQAAFSEVLRGGQFILGPNVQALEAELAAYTGVDHAIGVANGSDAVHLALQAAGVGPGDEVICPAFTFFATAGAVARSGATPVFADIDPATYTVTAETVALRLTKRTKALIPVHLYGHPAPMPELMRLAEAQSLTVIEDTAQAIGATVNGRRVAGIGHLGTYSFFPSKNLGAMGDAGMVTTNDPDLAERVRRLRVHGAHPRYYHHLLGYNSRLDELQAAILRIKLKRLDGWIAARRTAAERYNRLLSQAGLIGQVAVPTEAPGCFHVYHQYTVRAERRGALQAHLENCGIGTAVYYPLPLHLQPVFAELGYRPGDLPATEQACAEVLSLPIFPELTAEQQEYVVAQIQAFYTR
jgi:dTDP-4-amino-4,6-dideoxygalactose transaminase